MHVHNQLIDRSFASFIHLRKILNLCLLHIEVNFTIVLQNVRQFTEEPSQIYENSSLIKKDCTTSSLPRIAKPKHLIPGKMYSKRKIELLISSKFSKLMSFTQSLWRRGSIIFLIASFFYILAHICKT